MNCHKLNTPKESPTKSRNKTLSAPLRPPNVLYLSRDSFYA